MRFAECFIEREPLTVICNNEIQGVASFCKFNMLDATPPMFVGIVERFLNQAVYRDLDREGHGVGEVSQTKRDTLSTASFVFAHGFDRDFPQCERLEFGQAQTPRDIPDLLCRTL